MKDFDVDHDIDGLVNGLTSSNSAYTSLAFDLNSLIVQLGNRELIHTLCIA